VEGEWRPAFVDVTRRTMALVQTRPPHVSVTDASWIIVRHLDAPLRVVLIHTNKALQAAGKRETDAVELTRVISVLTREGLVLLGDSTPWEFIHLGTDIGRDASLRSRSRFAVARARATPRTTHLGPSQPWSAYSSYPLVTRSATGWDMGSLEVRFSLAAMMAVVMAQRTASSLEPTPPLRLMSLRVISASCRSACRRKSDQGPGPRIALTAPVKGFRDGLLHPQTPSHQSPILRPQQASDPGILGSTFGPDSADAA